MFVGVCGGKDLSPKVTRDLDRGLTDSARAGVDEDPLASAQPAQLHQRDVGSRKRHRHRRGLLKRQPRRDGHHHAVIGDRGRGKGIVGEQTHHRITALHGAHIRGNVDDDPGGFGTHTHIGDGADGHDHIVEVQPGSADRHPDLPGSQHCRLGGHQGQIRQITLAGGTELPVRARRWRQEGGRSEPGNVNAAVAQRKLGFAETLAQRRQDIDQQALVAGGSGVDQADPAGVFVLGAMGQRPHRGVRQIRGPIMNTGRYRMTGQDDQMSTQRLGASQPTLQLSQHTLGQSVHPRQRVVLGCLRTRQRPDHQIGVVQIGVRQISVGGDLTQPGAKVIRLSGDDGPGG
ncbi:hypothetical protein MSIMFI_05433 [Mycobacterium simulans]|nr:hypothetical protein MSIMFI_05433 [Mycobacterium simulans]